MNHIKKRHFKVAPSILHGAKKEKLTEKHDKSFKCSEDEAMAYLYSNHI